MTVLTLHWHCHCKSLSAFLACIVLFCFTQVCFVNFKTMIMIMIMTIMMIMNHDDTDDHDDRDDRDDDDHHDDHGDDDRS